MGRFSQKSKFEQIKADRYHNRIVAKRIRITVRLIIVAAVVLGFYFFGVVFFGSFFYPRTVINGVNCSWKTVSACSEILSHGADGYTITLYEQDGSTEVITGEEIQFAFLPEEGLTRLLDEQNGFDWFVHFFKPTELEFDIPVSYNEASLIEAMNRLNCMNEDVVIHPVEPELTGYVEGAGYSVTEPVYGNVINRTEMLANLKSAVGQMIPTLHLAETGCYQGADFREELSRLEEVRDFLNQYVNTVITYEFGSEQVVLEGQQILDIMTIKEAVPAEGAAVTEASDGEDSAPSDSEESGENVRYVELTVDDLLQDTSGSIDLDSLTVEFDRNWLAEFVYDMAYTYNTKYQYHKLITHSGTEITVGGGNYGWYLDQTNTLNELIGYLESGESYTGEAVFVQRAAQFDFPDYGNTYLEVSLSEQHFWYYRDGVLTLESDLVSGNPTTGHETPKGTYQIAYKARDQVLTGEDYSSPVSYWMPFYAGVGFHDASWRSSFGGTIYKYAGSHGCLNLPFSVAETLYGYIEGGEAVLIY